MLTSYHFSKEHWNLNAKQRASYAETSLTEEKCVRLNYAEYIFCRAKFSSSCRALFEVKVESRLLLL